MSPTASRCFGVLGQPIGHSASPRMHNAAFEALGLPHRYHAFAVAPEGLAAALAGAHAMGFGGLNVTVPHKRAIVPLLEHIDGAAAAIGAVNTVTFGPTGTTGYNTDCTGFVAGVAELLPVPPRSVVVLGSGGAGRAVVRGLLDEAPGRTVDWVSRRPDTLPGWKGIRARGWEALGECLATCDLLVNATSVGMRGGPPSFPTEVELPLMPAAGAVVDLVYPTPPGGLLERARDAGRPNQNGLPMLLWQGVRALEHWLDAGQVPAEVVTSMRAALQS